MSYMQDNKPKSTDDDWARNIFWPDRFKHAVGFSLYLASQRFIIATGSFLWTPSHFYQTNYSTTPSAWLFCKTTHIWRQHYFISETGTWVKMLCPLLTSNFLSVLWRCLSIVALLNSQNDFTWTARLRATHWHIFRLHPSATWTHSSPCSLHDQHFFGGYNSLSLFILTRNLAQNSLHQIESGLMKQMLNKGVKNLFDSSHSFHRDVFVENTSESWIKIQASAILAWIRTKWKLSTATANQGKHD